MVLVMLGDCINGGMGVCYFEDDMPTSFVTN